MRHNASKRLDDAAQVRLEDLVAGKSLEAAARALGSTPTTVAKLLDGGAGSPPTVDRISERLGKL